MSLTILKYFKNNTNSKELKKRDGDAGYDLSSVGTYNIAPKERMLIDVGVNVQIPPDYYLQIFPRSSMACKGIDTSAGVIDSSYRGKVKVLLVNNGKESFHVDIGDRIAQAVLINIGYSKTLKVESVEELSDTERGDGGFGSTGK